MTTIFFYPDKYETLDNLTDLKLVFQSIFAKGIWFDIYKADEIIGEIRFDYNDFDNTCVYRDDIIDITDFFSEFLLDRIKQVGDVKVDLIKEKCGRWIL